MDTDYACLSILFIHDKINIVMGG